MSANPATSGRHLNSLPLNEGSTEISAPKKELDLSRLFYQFNLKDLGNKKFALFLPANLLPAYFLKKFLEFKTEKDYEPATPNERVRKWRRIENTDAYEIASICPPKIRNLKLLAFTARCGGTLHEILKGSQTVDFSSVIPSICTKEGTKNSGIQMSQTNKSNVIAFTTDISGPNKEEHSLARLMAVALLDDFGVEVTKLINQYGTQLHPNESVSLIWDILSQAVLKKAHFSAEETNRLSIALFNFWTSFHLHLFKARLGSDDDLVNAIDLLKQFEQSLSNNLPQNGGRFLRQLKQIKQPLLDLLIQGHRTVGILKQEFLLQLSQFLNKRLLKLANISLSLDSSRQLVRNWLEDQSHLLTLFQKTRDQSEVILIGLSEEISTFIKEQQWLEAYTKIKAFTETLQSLSKERTFYQLRLEQFAKSLKEGFEYVIKTNQLFQIISEVAVEQIKDSCIAFQKENEPSQGLGTELIQWAQALKKQGSKDVFVALKTLQTAWKELKFARTELLTQELILHTKDFISQVEQNDYDKLPQNYLKIATQLNQFMPNWESSLKTLNLAIIQLQQASFLALTQPTLPQIDLCLVQKDFKEFNQRLGELIKPMLVFVNAFYEIICINKTSPQDSSFQFNEKNIVLQLFSEDESEFKNLRTLINEINRLPEESVIDIIEEPNIQEEPLDIPAQELGVQLNSNSVESMNQEVKQIFKQVKITKIRQELFCYLNKHGIDFTQEPGGKHTKIFINGKLIAMPTHTTAWAPGTAKSIRNAVLEGLKQKSEPQLPTL